MKVRLKHERLAEELARSPLTLNRWAQRMGLSSGHLSLLANGHRPYPTAKTRDRILKVLELEFDDLFELEQQGEAAAPPAEHGAGAPPLEFGGVERRPPAHFSDFGAPRPRTRRRLVSYAGRCSPGRHREEATSSMMRDLMHDLRWASRRLTKRPAWALATIATLAVGIGANVALFSVVNATLLKPYPYPEPERLFLLGCHEIDEPRVGGSCSWPDTVDLRQQLAGTLDLAPWDWEPASLAGGARPERVGTALTTANFARVFGLEPILGRFFSEEEQRQRASVAVLSEKTWRESFGADPAIVGRPILVDGFDFEVVGVVPDALRSIDGVQMYLPMRASDDPRSRGSHWLGVFARVERGVPIEQARGQLANAMQGLAAEYPSTNENKTADLTSLREARTADLRPTMLSLLAVVAAVLLIVCANVSNLLLSQATDRQEEIGLRAALGADRSRLLRLLLSECLVLCAWALAAGLLIGTWGAQGLLRWLPADELPAWLEPSADWRVFAYGAMVALATVLLAGLYPALRQTASLRRSSAAGGRSRRSVKATSGLVIAEVALSVALLASAGMMVRSLLELAERDPGFRTQGAVVVGLDLLALRREEGSVRRSRFLEYYDAFAAVPGVEAVGAIDRIPLGGGRNRSGLTAEEPDAKSYDPFATVSRVTPGYFEAMGIALLRGVAFDASTYRRLALAEAAESAGAEGDERRELVISRSLAQGMWPQGEAIGRRVKFARPEDEAPWWTVVGVVEDVSHDSLAQRNLQSVYMAQGGIGMTRATWVVRSEVPNAVLFDELRSRVQAIDPSQPLWGVRSLAEHVQASMWEERFVSNIFLLFGALAAVLAALGLYSVVSYAVARRRYEIGVRMALGATNRGVARMMIGEGLRWVAIGAGIGLVLAFATGRLLSGVLYEVTAWDPLLYAAVLALLLGVGLCAVAIPARRVTRLDPLDSLRCD